MSPPPAQPGWGWPGLVRCQAKAPFSPRWCLEASQVTAPRNNFNNTGLAHQLMTCSSLSSVPLAAVQLHFKDKETEAPKMAEHLPMVLQQVWAKPKLLAATLA